MTASVSSPQLVTSGMVQQARVRIERFVHRTAVLTSETLNLRTGGRLFFKCENFQRSGSFKIRGAFNALLSLTDAELAYGVVTSSSGNQAAALALAARTRQAVAYIAMPRIASKPKVAAVHRYGGNVVWVSGRAEIPTSEEYDETVARIQRETRAAAIHPYNDVRTIAGQGTCALELLEQVPDVECILVPLGGGGLLAGTLLAAKKIKPAIRVIGCEPEMADDARRSLLAGHIVPQVNPHTIADGLRTSLGDITYPIIAQYVDDVVVASEEAIVAATRLVWESMKIIIEPSSAVPVAALLEARVALRSGATVIVLSGGNVDLGNLPWKTPKS